MLLIGLWHSGSVSLLLFMLTLFATFASTAPMSFRLTSSEVLPPWVFLRISLFLQKGGMPLEGLGMPMVLPEGFPLLPLDLVQREGWGSLWSRVQCERARFCLLGSFVDWGYWSCSRATNSCYFLCSRLSLPSHLCTLGEVVRRVRFLSAAPVSFPPWPLNLRLERQGGYLSPLLVEWLSFAVLLLALSLR